MKLILLCLLSISLFADKLEFPSKVKETIAIQVSQTKIISFKILCINGYQYLYIAESQTTTQMFEKIGINSSPIKCNGFEDK